MRVKTELSAMPGAFRLAVENGMANILFYTDVEQIELEDGGTAYSAIQWDLSVPYIPTLEAEITSNLTPWLEAAKLAAYNSASFEAREKRNVLLAESDASMALDRLGLSVPSGSNFTAWLSFLRNLGSALTGELARYRQLLRDLPEQEGFPYEINWPNKPIL